MTNSKATIGTTSGTQPCWNHTANGKATQIGKAPGGAYIQFGWDALGLLKAVSDNGNSHEFTYNPSGLRISDKRTGTNAHDKRYVYKPTYSIIDCKRYL